MGNVGSRPDDGAALHLRDPSRLSIASLVITNSRQKTIASIVPNAFPATRLTAKRDVGDDTPIEFIQDPDASPSSAPNFILRLTNDDDLVFRFTFFVRQPQLPANAGSDVQPSTLLSDTIIHGLTFAYASSARELDNLVTREFHADPNLHKNSNVQFIGDFSTDGSAAVQFAWTWTWRPPKPTEDKGGGWRNICSFLEYDQKAHRLNTLATFAFWVTNTQKLQSTPMTSPGLELLVPPRLRVPSSQSYHSRVSDSEAPTEVPEPSSPGELPLEPVGFTQPAAPVKVDVALGRPGEDMSAVDDGPVFRATMKALEQKTGSMRSKIKKVLKKAEAAQQAQVECNVAVKAFLNALQEASTTNATAIKPALDHYFNQIAQQILQYEIDNSRDLRRLIIEPMAKLYNLDIKQAEAKKKDFEDESRDYYAYLGRYLGQRQDSLKDKKRAESDSKYQSKRRTFELARFDYSSFMQDLHGGRKEQELLSQLTKYAETQAQSFLATAKKVEDMRPQLEALVHEVNEADKEFKFQRTEREEKRRTLEKSSVQYKEPEVAPSPSINSVIPAASNAGSSYVSDSEVGRSDSTASNNTRAANGSALYPSLSHASSTSTTVSSPPTSAALASTVSPVHNRFKGIRDLEDRDPKGTLSEQSATAHRKEGLLWAMSRPGSHIDPRGINKQAWHKFWIVLDQGRLSEYSNWKERLDLHMEPIDLRMASVRVARDAERRFCFEVITPQFKRIYQATSEDDMASWINAINNALQSAMEGRSAQPPPPSSSRSETSGRDIGSVLTGKSSSLSGQHGIPHRNDATGVNRRTTVGARPVFVRTDSNSYEENPSKLLQVIREADQGNCWCADCGSGAKVEWCSINLGIVLCIECSGIHRSLGTHISKIRSLTLDVNSFTNDIVEILLLIGNRVSNMIWEAKLDPTMKPISSSTREQRLKFITAKYAQRAFVSSISSSALAFATPDDTLLTSIKKNDIQGVLHGIALRANVNAHDKSRDTAAVFLALAAADPATPGSTLTSPAASPRTKPIAGPPKIVPFAVAELLLQNGAEIPAQMPAIPLSPAAQLYIEQRTGRATSSGAGGTSGGRDTLGALPTIRGVGGSTVPGSFAGPTDNQSKEAKIQKRGSAGSRFAGKVASLGGV